LSRVLSIDYGEKRVGLALSDLLQIIAKPFDTLLYKTDDDLIKNILNIAETNIVSKIIVGIPLTLKGKHSEQTNKVLKFINLLKNQSSIPVEQYDERLSSIQAKRTLVMQGIKTGHNKSEVDKTAAAIFLQGYLDGQSNKK